MKLKLRRQGDVYIYELSGAVETDAEKELVDSVQKRMHRSLKNPAGQCILALGESSGHAHVIEQEDTMLWELDNDEAGNLRSLLDLDFIIQDARRVLENNPFQPPRLLIVEKEATLIHKNLKTGELTKEHDDIILPKGTHFVVHQREYAEQGTRQVWD